MTRRDKIKVAIAMYVVTAGFGGARGATVDEALKRVYFRESSNGKNDDAYVENHATALGPLQITRIVVRDVNRILKAPVFSYNDRLDYDASVEMFRVYCKHYYKNGTIEQICRLWYRGPNKKRQYDKHGDEYWSLILSDAPRRDAENGANR